MNHFQRAVAGVAATAAVLSIGVAAYSQEAQPQPRQGPPTAEQRQAWMQQRQQQMAQRRQEMAQRLQAVLQLRPDQQPAFQAFQAAMTPEPRQHQHRDRGAGPITTPQRLDMMAQRMAERDAAFQRRAAAIKTFYAALSPEQQRAFDSLPMPGRDGDRGDRGDRGHGPRGRSAWGPPSQG